LLGASRQHHGVELGEQLLAADRLRLFVAGPDRSAADHVINAKFHPFGLHLAEAAVNDPLLQFEVGNAIAQQPADSVVFFEHHHGMADAR
jgi:hypothetical protein